MAARARQRPDRVDDAGLLAAGDEVVDEYAHPPAGPGPNSAIAAGEVVDAVQHLHDDPLDAQVVAPHLLDQLGVVATLDEQPGRGRHGRPLTAHRRRPARRPRLGLAGLGQRRGSHPLRACENHRHTVDEEAGPERETPRAAAPVLEVHDVHTAGLLDPDHRAAPAGVGVLDHEARLGGHVRRRRSTTGPPVAGTRRTRSGPLGSVGSRWEGRHPYRSGWRRAEADGPRPRERAGRGRRRRLGRRLALWHPECQPGVEESGTPVNEPAKEVAP